MCKRPHDIAAHVANTLGFGDRAPAAGNVTMSWWGITIGFLPKFPSGFIAAVFGSAITFIASPVAKEAGIHFR
jgi:hypothetical protein